MHDPPPSRSMIGKRACLLATGLLIVAGWTSAWAQEQTVGLFINDERAYEGYTLIAPLFNPSTYLIDMDGQVVHSWEHEQRPHVVTYLLPNGNLLRPSRSSNTHPQPAINRPGGSIQEIDWDGTVVWNFEYSDSLHALHHDVEKLPNGNVLMIAWEYKNAEEAIAAGRKPDSTSLPAAALWPDHLIEVRPLPPDSGEIVWQWHVWDHLIQDFDPTKANFGVVEDHPELIDINAVIGNSAGDWQHFNALNYHEELDQIILSSPFFNELWVIDHNTTTQEAAGHTGGGSGKGGDLLYRWGNPEVYRAGTEADQQLFFQHHTHWIEPGLPGAGNILLFNNRLRNPPHSSILELTLPTDDNGAYRFALDGSFSPPEVIWQYADSPVFYSDFISGAQRLPNGNTLIDEGMTGRIFEITPDGEIVWQYVNPVVFEGPLAQGDSIPPGVPAGPHRLANSVFRAYRYGIDYAGLQGKDLTPRGPLELVPTATESEAGPPADFVLHQNYPNPFHPTTAVTFSVPRPSQVTLTVYNVLGQRVATLAQGRYGPGTHVLDFDATGLSSGVYFYRLESEGFTTTKTMLLIQ